MKATVKESPADYFSGFLYFMLVIDYTKGIFSLQYAAWCKVSFFMASFFTDIVKKVHTPWEIGPDANPSLAVVFSPEIGDPRRRTGAVLAASPTVGFIGKFCLFAGGIQAGLWTRIRNMIPP